MDFFLILKKINNKIIFFSIFVSIILYLQTQNYLWRGHLEVDVYVFYQRIEYFFQHGSFAFLKGNEHLPGALLFFFTPLILCFTKFNYGNYLQSFLIINIILLFFHVWLFGKVAEKYKQILFLLIILTSGPISLFRFELIVSLFILTAIIFWRRKKYFIAFFMLGISVTIKMYPLVILPYFFLILFNNQRYKKMLFGLLFFIIGILIPIMTFYLLGGSMQQLAYSMQFHSAKPVSIESFLGTFFTILSLIIEKKPPELLGGYGVWGVNTPFGGFEPVLFNWFWVLPIFWFYIFLLRNRIFVNSLKVGVIYWLIILFLIFSKNLHPQYIFWFIMLIPLLKINRETNADFLIIFGLTLIIVLINQYVYPLSYTNLIKYFYYSGEQLEIFILQLLRNLTIFVLFIFSFRKIFIDQTIE